MKRFIKIVSNHALMFKYVMKFAPAYMICQIIFCIYVSFISMFTGAYSLKYIFNGLQSGKTLKELLFFLGMVSVAMLVRHILGAITAEYLHATGLLKINAGMRKVIFEQARKMDLVYYETPKFYNDFVWAATQADEKISYMMRTWSVFVARLSDIIFFGGFILFTDGILILFAIAALVIRLIFSAKLVKKKYEMNVEIKPHERKRDYATRVFYLADYAKEIRLSDIHKTLFERLKNTMSEIKDIVKVKSKKLVLYSLISMLSVESFLDFFTWIYLAFKTVVSKTILFGDFAALSNAVVNFTDRTTEFIDVLAELAEQSLYVDNFKAFLAYKPKIEGQIGEEAPKTLMGISLRNVSFKYEGAKKYSLKNINLDIKPNEKIAIVGYNGAGKSTLVKLLMRFYDTSEGEITLGGKNIKNFSTKSYRALFGSVFQDYKIFASSIAENVEMNFFDEKRKFAVINALEDSGFSDKLSQLEDGIHTPLTREFNEKGVNLSGGEEQKIAIARIFAKDCPYVILDEPSSALDPISEYNLNHTMMTLSEDKSVIFISHRLSTTCMADRIIMLENGEIIEQGTHEELMSMNGKYAEMFNKQAEKYKV